ncbi:hypothetical protein D3C84_1180160 [compost metagenome]
MLLVVLADVGETEFARHLEVELNRCALPTALQCIANMEVDLRSVESAVALVDPIYDAAGVQHVAKRSLRFVP